MRVLDLCCKAGGATRGYQYLGWEVTGVDIEPQPHYIGEHFIQADMMDVALDGYDFIHASPPCQRFSTMTRRWGREAMHPDYIAPLRERLVASRVPWVIENVPGAPLINPTTLCGSMFGLPLRRHRGFETNFEVGAPPPHDHTGPVVGVYGNPGGSSRRDGLTFGGVDTWRKAMGIDWMTGRELREAIPPAYTRWVGSQFIRYREESNGNESHP